MSDNKLAADIIETPSESEEVHDDDEDQDVISMEDVLHEEEQLEADANAVLGDSDEKNCTYPLGYTTRQALYSCTTCSTNSDKPAVICLACSYACHEDHALIELYTKRNIRCDCGNSKFPKLKCQLYEYKDDENVNNKYNQNYQGLYCTCSRPYPDLDDETDDEMIQCVICEDWYHGRHLGTAVPSNNDFEEMICAGCMQGHPWLWAYTVNTADVIKMKRENGEDIKESVIVDDATCDEIDGFVSRSSQPGNKVEATTTTSQDGAAADDNCMLKNLMKREVTPVTCGAFWHDGWRKKLCRCPQCLERYKTENVEFLLDIHDSVKSYEDRGHSIRSVQSRLEKGMNALQNMNRVVLGEVVHGYNDLKDSLKEYLKKFAENKKVVREEDIREFFGQMEARKKRRLNEMPPTNCK